MDSGYSLMPIIHSLVEFFRVNWVMNPARRGHKPVTFTKTDDTSITGATKKQQISSVRIGIIGGFDLLVFSYFIAFSLTLPTRCIPAFQLFWVSYKHPPNIYQRRKNIRSNSITGSKRGQHCSAADERFNVSAKSPGKLRCNLRCVPLLVANPLQKLTGRRLYGRWIVGAENCQLHQCAKTACNPQKLQAECIRIWDNSINPSMLLPVKVIADDAHDKLRGLLKKARADGGVTQAELASRLGVPQSVGV